MNTNIYRLTDGNLNYIGKADNPEKRYQEHYSDSFNPSRSTYYYRLGRWIRGLPNPPEMEILEQVDYQDWAEAERYWISYFRELYGEENVLNQNSGGNDPSGDNNPNTKLSWDDVYYIRSSDLSTIDLALTFGVSRSAINKVRRNYSWYDPEYDYTIREGQQGENNARAKVTWYEVFLFRLNYKPYGKGKRSKSYATSRLGISQSMLDKIIRNINWYDENWDPEYREYIGPPQNWEESWGDWS